MINHSHYLRQSTFITASDYYYYYYYYQHHHHHHHHYYRECDALYFIFWYITMSAMLLLLLLQNTHSFSKPYILILRSSSLDFFPSCSVHILWYLVTAGLRIIAAWIKILLLQSNKTILPQLWLAACCILMLPWLLQASSINKWPNQENPPYKQQLPKCILLS